MTDDRYLSKNLAIGLILSLGFLLALLIYGLDQQSTNELTKVAESDRKDQISGCKRNAKRTEAILLSAAAGAIGDSRVAADPRMSAKTVQARTASAATHWQTTTELAATLIDCAAAFPPGDKEGESIVDIGALQRVNGHLEQEFGEFDDAVPKDLGERIRREVKANGSKFPAGIGG